VGDLTATERGRLTLDELRGLVGREQIDTVVVGFTDHYGRLLGKRYDAEMFIDETAAHGSHGCDYLLTTDMEMDPTPGYRFANWQKGYGDFHLLPDLGTLSVASWLDKTALVLCDVKTRTGTEVSVAPRSILRRQVEAARELGFNPTAASELEYYLFQQSYRQAADLDYRTIQPAGWYFEDYHILQGTRTEPFTAAVRRHLKASGVPVETSKGEWGLGQHEINVRYAEALQMADRHVVYKQCLKEVADRMELSVTFMAKFAADRAGSSCHTHFSLWRTGKNAFDGDASWAPTRVAWSYDNRTAAFRVVGQGSSLRIECRIPGADCNPYLTFAAALASGLDGIRNRIEPPPCFKGDMYAARDLPHVPGSLDEAANRFAASEFAARTFGVDVVEHYAHFFRTEQAAFDRAVTDWERRRYFERI